MESKPFVINGKSFYEVPSHCHQCPFFVTGESMFVQATKGHCILFDEMHRITIQAPPRCKKLFNKACRMAKAGTQKDFIIVIKEPL